MTKTEAERLAVLESRMDQFEKNQIEGNNKLDSLLELKNKGAGAFWLASAIFGTGIIGSFLAFLDWIKHG